MGSFTTSIHCIYMYCFEIIIFFDIFFLARATRVLEEVLVCEQSMEERRSVETRGQYNTTVLMAGQVVDVCEHHQFAFSDTR